MKAGKGLLNGNGCDIAAQIGVRIGIRKGHRHVTRLQGMLQTEIAAQFHGCQRMHAAGQAPAGQAVGLFPSQLPGTGSGQYKKGPPVFDEAVDLVE